MRRLPLVAIALGALVVPGPDPASSLRPVMRVEYSGGSELAYDGRYVYAGQFNGRTDRNQTPRQGGVRIVDATTAKEVGRIDCPGTDMDVTVPRPGLLAVGYHVSRCGIRGNGVTLFDVSDPAKPRQLGSVAVERAHTLTAVPGTHYLYVSPGGLRSGRGLTSVVDVSDPALPEVVARFAPDEWGCHDVTFARTRARTLGVCAGGGGTRLWDMKDPLRPREIARIDNPDVQFAHGAAVSDDGRLLVLNDEAYQSHRCGSASGPAGALHLYDVTRAEKPVYVGRISPPRGRVERGGGASVENWCTAHQLNFVPGTRRLVNAWFTGGVSVWDLSVPSSPREIASYRRDDSIAWTAHWFGGRVWVNDMSRGLEALDLELGSWPGAVPPTWKPASEIRFESGERRFPPQVPKLLLCPVR